MIRTLLVFLILLPLELLAQSAPQTNDRRPGPPDRGDIGWVESPRLDLTRPGPITWNMQNCPAGVRGDEPYYFVYVFDDPQSEAVPVTGGSCKGDGQAGTLQFTTLKAHQAGYKIGSATGGLQEALIAARFTPTNPTGVPQAGRVIVPAGEYKLYAQLSVRSSSMTVDLSGSILECYMDTACIFVGDRKNSIAFIGITLIGPRGRAAVPKGADPFIEVNAQSTRLLNVASRVPLKGGTFSTLVQVDDDQAFLLDGLTVSPGATGLRCDASVCSPVISAPGPFNTYSAVGWIKNINLTLGCGANGIDWQSGNTLRVSDSVIQGYAQYGVRAGTRRGGMGGFALENIYEEVGNCKNPLGNIGISGVVAQGSGIFGVKIEGGVGPAGSVPRFANTGRTDYRYYIVAKHATLGASNPLYAGNALTNGTGNISVTIPDIPGAATFDLLRTQVGGELRNQAPFRSGDFAVITGVDHASACANGVCTFTDSQAALKSYNVASPSYFPRLDWWPAALVLGSGTDSGSVNAPAHAYLDNAFDGIVSVAGSSGPSVFANRCGASDKWTPTWVTCFNSEAPSIMHEQSGFILMAKANRDDGRRLNLKGRLNFATLGTGPGHIVTLSDSNFDKTIATANNRPSNDANDAYIGYDEAKGDASQIGISFGAPKSLSNYIGNAGDGKQWLERLTATQKAFKVPVSAPAFQTTSNCVSANGSCGADAAGRVAIAAGQKSVSVTTSVVTANSEIHIDENFSYGPQLGVTCNRTIGRHYVISEQTTGKFVIETDTAPVGSPACLSFSISN